MSYTNPVLRCISNFFRQLIIVLPYIYAAVPLLHSLWNWCTALRSDSWRIFPDHSCIPGIRHGLLYGILTAGIQDISHNHRTHRKHTSTAFYGLRTLVGCVQKSAAVKSSCKYGAFYTQHRPQRLLPQENIPLPCRKLHQRTLCRGLCL